MGSLRRTLAADPLDRKMLDLVLGGAKNPRRTPLQDDQHKLDENLDTEHSVERRVAAIEFRQKEAALEKAGVSATKRHASDSPPIEIKILLGDGTLLDNCIMMWGSGLEDDNKHQRENLPFIVAGRGGGTLNTGRFLTGVRGNQGDLPHDIARLRRRPPRRPHRHRDENDHGDPGDGLRGA